MDAGEKLKEIRNRLGLSTRNVHMLSLKIAEQEHNEEFEISWSRVTEIENEKESQPGPHKMFTLACIYGMSYDQILLLYGVDAQKTAVYHTGMPGEKTHLIHFQRADELKSLEIPSQVSELLDLNQTSLLPQMIGPWASVPAALLHDFDLRYHRYGYIGLQDYTLYPLITPGSFVAIDPEVTRPVHIHARNEHERPVYFLDLRKEYACGWCDLVDSKLLLIPHPISNLETRMFTFPGEADIIGQVTGVAMRIATPRRKHPAST
jgi:hypothetical protein